MGGLGEEHMDEDECARLLRSMELVQSDEEIDKDLGEVEAQDTFSMEEWEEVRKISEEIVKEQSQMENQPNKEKEETVKPNSSMLKRCTEEEIKKEPEKNKKKMKWGPVEVQRKSSRHGNDTRNMMEKAIDQARFKNLEAPNGTGLEEYEDSGERAAQDDQEMEATMPNRAENKVGSWDCKTGETGGRSSEDLHRRHYTVGKELRLLRQSVIEEERVYPMHKL